MRIFYGFLVQPLSAATLGFLAFPLIEFTRRAIEGGTTSDPMRAAISVGLAAGFAAFMVTVCGALPVVAWLLKRGPLRLKQILWGGALLGNLPFAVILLMSFLTNNISAGASWLGLLRALTLGALFGVVGAALFWAISIRGTALGPGEMQP